MIWNRDLLDEINAKLNSDGGISKCPICGYDYSHERVRELSPEETGTRQGGHMILLEGECGHTWGTVYAEHKGQVVEVPIVFQAIPLLRIVENAVDVDELALAAQAEQCGHQGGEVHGE